MTTEASTDTRADSRIQIERVQLTHGFGVAIREKHPIADLPSFFASAFAEMAAAVSASGAHFAGPPFARYHAVPPGPIDVEAVMPVDVAVAPRGRVTSVELAAGPALQALHVGPYDTMGPIYDAVAAAMAERRLEPSEPPREVYLSDPAAEPDPRTWRTLVVQPARAAKAL